MSHNYLDWAKYQNRHSSKSIWVMKLFFCQNSHLMGQSFWQKNSFITHIVFELCLFWYLARSTSLWDTLYWEKFCVIQRVAVIFLRILGMINKCWNCWNYEYWYLISSKIFSPHAIFKTLRLFFLINLPGPKFISCPMSILDSRVHPKLQCPC